MFNVRWNKFDLIGSANSNEIISVISFWILSVLDFVLTFTDFELNLLMRIRLQKFSFFFFFNWLIKKWTHSKLKRYQNSIRIEQFNSNWLNYKMIKSTTTKHFRNDYSQKKRKKNQTYTHSPCNTHRVVIHQYPWFLGAEISTSNAIESRTS